MLLRNSVARQKAMEIYVKFLSYTFALFIFRMKLLHQVSRVWRTDGLNSCVYKLLSVDYNPLYVNITVDFWTGP